MRGGLRRRSLLVIPAAFALGAGSATLADAPLVAAGSDLQFALSEIAERFRREGGGELRLVFGSSGNLARQIRQGAPFELFFSADEDYVLALARDGFTRDEGAIYAIGRLALFVPAGSPLGADGSLADLARAIEDGRLRRFAIANPEHAPYGKRAREALERRGLWQKILPFLVYGENVGQAAQFAASGNVQGAILAHSLVLAPSLAARGSHALIPAEWHEPLRQRVVLVKHAGPTAERLYAYARSEPARAILRRWGFLVPDETIGR
ncbi:MAG: molybdate ABC transporter substrate-binding protein [Geminicoccaceae bacterium]|nr:molybdate ABC transporter substrate-binding protein [Geminicoccaceae bacterium]MCS7269156.1 molybdate ABC transporter substrate-binding protein [Geminicoccaceae bacterium]MCX7631266.1 molybdate ABC transporter substrate-binding protein [Geminicoccaceae bacterium]MDW8125302.1 molybdate ABC transporter substrate-binding protein [Geminicoccaceae bacterium]MDW8342455.1 molybdate ABC transporter substrate-binding protein [Geminicoccaceae bacterium]